MLKLKGFCRSFKIWFSSSSYYCSGSRLNLVSGEKNLRMLDLGEGFLLGGVFLILVFYTFSFWS